MDGGYRSRGVGCFDGTPILGVNGYQPDYRAEGFSMPDRYQRLMESRGISESGADGETVSPPGKVQSRSVISAESSQFVVGVAESHRLRDE